MSARPLWAASQATTRLLARSSRRGMTNGRERLYRPGRHVSTANLPSAGRVAGVYPPSAAARLHAFVATDSRAVPARARRRRKTSTRVRVQRGALAFLLLAITGSVLGLVFAGSPERIAAGVQIDGVDVGGMKPRDAERLLERRARALERVPVVFVAAGRRWRVTPDQLGVTGDWHAAVGLAQRHGDGFGPFRGFRRIGVRVFGADVAPPTRVYEAGLAFEIERFARAVYRPHQDARLRLHGLEPVVVKGSAGRALDRAALSAPVRLRWQATTWTISPWQLRTLLALPGPRVASLGIGGPGAARYFADLRRALNRRARNAGFAVAPSGSVALIPSRRGQKLAVGRTEANLFRAALSSDKRVARVVITTSQPDRTTREARAMGIRGLAGGYETVYGGDANRVHNVQLVARLLDGTLIAPGQTFSFNRATGARTAEKGFREAPVIINGELQTGLGGGVCPGSTTVFNPAYEAGLKITDRTNHALYISHYPQGRDATVNYPDVDLKFVNDTSHWLLLRTFVGSYSLVVDLYGAPLHRRVVSQTRPLVETE